MDIARATTEAELETCLAIRHVVFVEEQAVPPEEEVDGMDPDCLHYLLRVDQAPIATARVLRRGTKAKIQRVAVLKTGRSARLGSKLMQFILEDLRQNHDFKSAVLGSQTHAIGFYQKLGFEPFGPEYDDAGIPHRDMERAL